ncbi:hypothetical protein CAter282_0969 [Collimonas arenae]|uniref:Uncharacterized protein n=1 Tax=Collimonas arenae TaxID=279058 RepID=A0A127QFD6_9BURK|nr:hypothetical protein CAter282_0969 [Collimonas arenae]
MISAKFAAWVARRNSSYTRSTKYFIHIEKITDLFLFGNI